MSTVRIQSVIGYACQTNSIFNAGTPPICPKSLWAHTGWWKDPVSTSLSFVNDQGAKYAIHWVIKYGNESTLLNPLGSSLLNAKKYYHTVSLPDGATSDVAILQPTGVLRIDRDSNALKVLINGQVAATGTIRPMGQFVGFEIGVVKARNGSLSFTDFKIAR